MLVFLQSSDYLWSFITWTLFGCTTMHCFLVLVPRCEPPPNLGAKVPGNHRRSPAGPAKGKRIAGPADLAKLQECFYTKLSSCPTKTYSTAIIKKSFINLTCDNCIIIILFTSWLHDASSLLQHLSAHILVPALLLLLRLHCKQELHVKNVGCACALALFPADNDSLLT